MIIAHGTVAPESLWSAWTPDPLLLVGLAGAAWFYGRGFMRLRSPVRRSRRAVAFCLAVFGIAVALVSPLDALGETLFSAHMVQHLLLILVVAPLLVYGAPVTVMSLGLPASARRMLRRVERSSAGSALARAGRSPVAVLGLHVFVLWLWHLPTLYEAALRTRWVHIAEHVTFLGTALLLWALVIAGVRQRRRLDHGPAILTVFLNLLQSGALGVILVFATTELYPLHAAGASAWGLTLIEDQQLAGSIMWVPSGTVYFVTMAVLFLRWMRTLDERSGRAAPGGANG